MFHGNVAFLVNYGTLLGFKKSPLCRPLLDIVLIILGVIDDVL